MSPFHLIFALIIPSIPHYLSPAFNRHQSRITQGFLVGIARSDGILQGIALAIFALDPC